MEGEWRQGVLCTLVVEVRAFKLHRAQPHYEESAYDETQSLHRRNALNRYLSPVMWVHSVTQYIGSGGLDSILMGIYMYYHYYYYHGDLHVLLLLLLLLLMGIYVLLLLLLS